MVHQATRPQTRRCCECLEQKALSEFRRVRKGGERRRTDCYQCHNRREAKRIRHRRQKQQGAVVQKLSTQICQAPPSDPTRIARIAEGLIAESGGWNKFVGIWRQTLETARRQKRFGRVYRMLNSLQKLQLASEQLQVEARETEPDDAQFHRSIRESPEAAAFVLDSLGWTTAPPQSVE